MKYIDKVVFKAEVDNAFKEVIDPTGSPHDADQNSRDNYYFKEGILAALTLIKDEDFNFEKIKEEHGYECSLFSDAMSVFRNSLRIGHNINKQKLEEKIKLVLGGM